MYYKLHPSVSLRGWPGIPYACQQSGMRLAHILSREECELLEKCDGMTELEMSPMLSDMLERKYAIPCKKGEKNRQHQRMHRYGNLYFPTVNLAVTGRCNYNCRHCFAAKNYGDTFDELTGNECVEIFDDCVSCGIHNVCFTGGEPFLRNDLIKLAEEVARRRLYLAEIATNGSLITEDDIDAFQTLGQRPLFKISFDGIGHHDWMRRMKGAEKKALDAVSLVKRKGMEVKIQTCLDRENVKVLYDTALLMESLGVDEMRIIRTSESPRWLSEGKGIGLTPEEYFDAGLSFFERYCREKHSMGITIWGLGKFMPGWLGPKFLYQRKLSRPVHEGLPVCSSYREQLFIGCDGSLMPCQPQSGYMAGQGMDWGNVRRTRLRELLKDQAYLKHVTCTLGELLRQNSTCASCPHFPACWGGCRAIGYALTGNYFGEDYMQCVFFKKGFFNRAEMLYRDSRSVGCGADSN